MFRIFSNVQTLFRISSTKTGLSRISWLCSVHATDKISTIYVRSGVLENHLPCGSWSSNIVKVWQFNVHWQFQCLIGILMGLIFSDEDWTCYCDKHTKTVQLWITAIWSGTILNIMAKPTTALYDHSILTRESWTSVC